MKIIKLNNSISKEKLFELCNNNLDFEKEEELYEKVLIDILASKEIYQTKKNRYAPSMLYNVEKKILEFFQKRTKIKPHKTIMSNFENYIIKKENSQ